MKKPYSLQRPHCNALAQAAHLVQAVYNDSRDALTETGWLEVKHCSGSIAL